MLVKFNVRPPEAPPILPQLIARVSEQTSNGSTVTMITLPDYGTYRRFVCEVDRDPSAIPGVGTWTSRVGRELVDLGVRAVCYEGGHIPDYSTQLTDHHHYASIEG